MGLIKLFHSKVLRTPIKLYAREVEVDESYQKKSLTVESRQKAYTNVRTVISELKLKQKC